MTKTDPINWERLEKMMINSMKAQDELRASQSRTDEQLAKTDAQLAKTDAQLAKTEALVAKMTASVTRISEKYGGLSENIGKQAEEFFYRGFKRNSIINGMKYDEVDRNVRVRGKEYDIVLYNGKAVALFSVKHKVHPKDIEKFVTKDIPEFTKSFPQYKDYDIYGGIATFALDDEISEQAEKQGLFVFTQSGENPKMINDKTFEAKTFQ